MLSLLALWAGALGPAGQDTRRALSLAIGISRLFVPPALATAAVLLVSGRRRIQPARPLLGAFLLLVALAGLGDLAGGAPGIHAGERVLGGAGGWLGVGIGGPLREGLSSWGAAVVLVALALVGLVVLTGVTLRQAAVTAGRSALAAFRGMGGLGGRGERTVEAAQGADGEPEEDAARPFGEEAGGEEAQDALPAEPEGASGGTHAEPVGTGEVPVVEEHDALTRETARRKADTEAGSEGGTAKGKQLSFRIGPPQGAWKLPPQRLLSRSTVRKLEKTEIQAAGNDLVAALAAHGVETRLLGFTVGPTVTRFELELGAGVKVARVTSLARDIAYAMASPDVRILAPIPGKSAIGVEVPNRTRQLVTLGDVLDSGEARRAGHPLEVALGRDIAGRAVMVNLAEMPHLLISGATGAGKSSCINSLLTSILLRSTPDQVRMILVDPKRVELGQYNGLPHLLTQVVIDPKKAANALAWAVKEMERRYDLLAEVGMRDITGYNAAVANGELEERSAWSRDEGKGAAGVGEVPEGQREEGIGPAGREQEEGGVELPFTEVEAERTDVRGAEEEPRYRALPFVLVVVDELNDLMMVAARDVEESVCRIAQMARAVGIHLVLATQRPSVDVITGLIKANIPSRLAFAVSSLADSRVILDQPGAERLIGKGDMLLLSASSSVPRRIQGPWVEESEVRSVVAFWRRQREAQYVEGLAGEEVQGGAFDEGDGDELLGAAMDLVVRSGLGSTSMLQRKLRVGFARAGRLMDLLERRGVVGPSEGSKARAVLMTPDELDELVH